MSERLVELSKQFPELAAQEMPCGRVKITLADKNCPIWLEYFQQSNVRSGDDAWRYLFSHSTREHESIGPYSHPAEKGCWVMARRYFIDNGYINIPSDNSHLSDATKAIVTKGQKRRDALSSVSSATPLTGDFIIDQNGTYRRVCRPYEDACQQTTALERSYYSSDMGTATFSGSLGESVPYARLTQTENKAPALFWTFRDGISGGGRGVDYWMNVTVWEFSGTFGAGLWEVN